MDEMFASFKCPVCGNVIHTTDEYCNCCHSVCTLVSVGREKCDIAIEDFYLSRHHLDIIYVQHHSKSFFTLINYGATGTVVGGRKLGNRESITIPNVGTMPSVLLGNGNNLDWEIVKRHIACKKKFNCDESPHCPNCTPTHMPMTTASRTPWIKRILTAPIAIISTPITLVSSGINSVVKAIKDRENQNKHKRPGTTFSPGMEGKQTNDNSQVYSSVFAPSEVKYESVLLVQVYLHLQDETESVKNLAKESQKNAERRDYIPLQCKLKIGDEVDVLLNIYGKTLLKSERRTVVWQGSLTKCSIGYFVPKDIETDELCCVSILSVSGIPIGEMRFITRIVEYEPRLLNPEIIAHKYSKVFISYSHLDESKVKFLHEGLELGSVPHFFDRKYLKAGDVFPQVIKDYINSADLFILCWSENASKSEYVQKERQQALERAFPKVRPEKDAKLRIYPMSIEPRAELPGDMKNYYHFGEI